mgnify:CR=1 FL=1
MDRRSKLDLINVAFLLLDRLNCTSIAIVQFGRNCFIVLRRFVAAYVFNVRVNQNSDVLRIAFIFILFDNLTKLALIALTVKNKINSHQEYNNIGACLRRMKGFLKDFRMNALNY